MVNRLIGKKLVGIKQTTKAIKSGEANVIYVAKDAENKLIEPVVTLAKENGCPRIEYVDTMKELGKLCGIDVGAAVAVVLKE